MKRPITTDEVLRKVEPSIRDAVSTSQPGVVFTDIWVKPRTSWCGSDMVDVWAVYDGDIEDLGAPAQPSLSTLIQDILWNVGLDASPSTHLVAKADAKDLSRLRPSDLLTTAGSSSPPVRGDRWSQTSVVRSARSTTRCSMVSPNAAPTSSSTRTDAASPAGSASTGL